MFTTAPSSWASLKGWTGTGAQQKGWGGRNHFSCSGRRKTWLPPPVLHSWVSIWISLCCVNKSLLPSSVVPQCKVFAGLATVVPCLVPQANLLFHVQYLWRKTKQKDHFFSSYRQGVEAVTLHSRAQLPHVAHWWYPEPAWLVQEQCVQHDTSVNEHCRKSQPAHKDRRLLLANWEVIPAADQEFHTGRFLWSGISLPLL